jgi:2-polyprenyl-6-methoxyphenol hydroxylase-like FAD-dependent oxidoreductase
VLIAGAGIAGLALARALRLRGSTHEVEVVERAGDRDLSGAGLYLPGNAVRALAELGLGDAVAGRAHPIRRQRFLDRGGRLIKEIDVEGYWAGVGGCLAIERAALHELLLEAAAEVPIRFGTSVTGLETGDTPRVTLSDGSSESYELVVGADGVHSSVRALALGGPAARYVGQASWRFVAQGFPDGDDWCVRIGRGRAFLTVPLGAGAVYCYADVNTDDPAGVEAGDWRGSFSDFAAPVPGLLEQAADAYYAPIEEVAPPAWTAPGVVLVGDAAHASSPNMAQGAAMAVEDALVLSGLLTDERALADALRAYEGRRRERVEWMQEQTHRRDRTRALPQPVVKLVLRLAGERIFRSNYDPLRELP